MGGVMARRNLIPLLTLLIILIFCFPGTQISFSQAITLTPEKIIDAHVKSIGNPEVLNSIKNRGINGTVTVQFIQGGAPGKTIGQFMLISAGQNLGLIMRYGALEYPGEHFAYDGNEVTIANISPGQRSPLGDFFYRYNGVIKEGLLGGVLTMNWPLLDIENRQIELKFNQVKIEGQELYEIEYLPNTRMNDVKVKLFFEPDTFHHVRTEYRLVVHGEQSLLTNAPYTHGTPKTKDAWNISSRYSAAAEAEGYIQGFNILDEVYDSIFDSGEGSHLYLLFEWFAGNPAY